MNSKNVINLNGQRYDAVTGSMLGPDTIAHTVTVNDAPKKQIDGISRTQKTAKKPETTDIAPNKPTVRHIAIHTVPRKPEATRTLMRSVVKKPGPGLKRQINVQHAVATKTPAAIVIPKTSVKSISQSRMVRANSVDRSEQVKHFAGTNETDLKPIYAPLPVKDAPEFMASVADAFNKPLDMFEAAVEDAEHFVDITAQKLQLKKLVRRHVATMATGSLLLVALGGFLAYQNIPSVQFKVAAFRAGVPSNLPNFAAAGFQYGRASVHNDQVTTGFNGNNANYHLIQRATNWSPDEMIQNVASTDASGTPNYSTVNADGTTVYRFSNTSATWVKNGTWYQVNGTGALSDDQLKSLAQNI